MDLVKIKLPYIEKAGPFGLAFFAFITYYIIWRFLISN